MPIYEYRCNKCECEITELQEIGKEAPKCLKCGVRMTKKPTHPAIIRVFSGGYPVRSKGYKEGYSKEVLRDVGIEK